MRHILIVGGASIDTLHLKAFKDRPVTTAGGVGLYTAMAARRAGAKVSMISPRPDPCPQEIQPAAAHLTEWLGPIIPPAQLPRFEISYQTGRTEYLDMFFGAAVEYSVDMIPANLERYDLVHIAQKPDILIQLAMIRACRQRGAKRIAGGTYPGDANQDPHIVRALIAEVDYFFMNKREATAVFGSLDAAHTTAGSVLFVTMGSEGARVIQGDFVTDIPAVPADELDPTGAGDTFCGAALTFLAQGQHPVMAARQAAALSAEMISQFGPAALLWDEPPPQTPIDARVALNEKQLTKTARVIATHSEYGPFPFVAPELPPAGHPQTVDYFFAATLQQFSFWSSTKNHYHLPMIAPLGGVTLKGSDYLWQAYSRALYRDPEFCSPQRQASLTRDEILQIFRADDGSDPMPALDLHLQQANSYGRDMLALDLTPQDILHNALSSERPLDTFLVSLDQIGGYKEDPLRKKSALLAMILNQRPENFFPLREDEQIPSVIDYHVLRSCLRMGLVDVVDRELELKIRSRQLVSPAEEWAVRRTSYLATEQLTALSGRSTGMVDWFLFNARKRCPEMSEPECALCPVDAVCAHRKELFQTVLRTTFY